MRLGEWCGVYDTRNPQTVLVGSNQFGVPRSLSVPLKSKVSGTHKLRQLIMKKEPSTLSRTITTGAGTAGSCVFGDGLGAAHRDYVDQAGREPLGPPIHAQARETSMNTSTPFRLVTGAISVGIVSFRGYSMRVRSQ